jgi:hypothetical protein
MANPAFVYAFDNLGPERFVQLCGLLLGSRYKGFLLTSPGPDGGVDAEDCPILGELVTESPSVLQEALLQPSMKAVFQFKHKVVARVGEANARKQLLAMYRSTKARKSEVLGDEIANRNPDVYILVTNVEVNSVFRSSFAEKCRRENPNIQNYQVIGLDELESWVTQERQLRTLYFPTIFSPARFNIALKLVLGYTYQQTTSLGNDGAEYSPDRPILCLTIMNIGEATSYLSSIKFKIYQQGKVSYFMKSPIPPNQIDPLANPKIGDPIEPGRSVEFRFPLIMFQRRVEENGEYFLDSVIVWDQIDNIYSLEISNEIREYLFGDNALVDSI